MRDMMMQQYIPGPLEGSYMATETEFVPPLVKQVKDYPAGYTVEMRGMWRVENDFMGGPFVSYTFADPRTGNLVTVEGYYYEPNQKKRNFLQNRLKIIPVMSVVLIFEFNPIFLKSLPSKCRKFKGGR